MQPFGSTLSEPSTLSTPNGARQHGSAHNVPTLENPLFMSRRLSWSFFERNATVVGEIFPQRNRVVVRCVSAHNTPPPPSHRLSPRLPGSKTPRSHSSKPASPASSTLTNRAPMPVLILTLFSNLAQRRGAILAACRNGPPRRKETLSSKIGLRHKSDKLLGGDNVDIFGLDRAKDFLAFVEIEFLLAVVCQKRLQLQTASNDDGQVVNGPLE
jgi:hypothetical protein